MTDHPDKSTRVPPAGVWAPAVTFFDPVTDELDLESQAKYFNYLSQHLTGLVILGTNAETFLLTREERAQLVETARQAVGPGYPLMAASRATPPSKSSNTCTTPTPRAPTTPSCSPAPTSASRPPRTSSRPSTPRSPPPPRCPSSSTTSPPSARVDLDSDTLAALARAHPAVVGVKLTCASVGKITRLAAEFPPDVFAVYGGQSDFLLAGLSVGSAGCIAAFANVVPRTLRHIERLYRAGRHEEALRLQRVAADAEACCKAGVASTKFAVSLTSARSAGVEGAEERLGPRRPYVGVGEEVKEGIRRRMARVMVVEEGL
ncbi:putative 4-hydroxy-2-oxoglutarate aldolase, mitochondrial [Teratosphaeria destructans]|uniref:4-hydroxy-2-oxoglutarate aldolase, mitochondrial n=1 Tax=Teratosphaeria destructans TaxID=418781 RepID=A0A9W7SQN7_9PEZI|nr:putative 4-hydroxy-2-oxoglutarate aldolase, mitochondrial [Teratosphaeria destructans]